MEDSLQHIPFESVWKMRIEVPYSLFVRDGDLLLSCGQCPLNEKGAVLHPNDLWTQATTVAGFIDQFLTKVGSDATAVAKLVVYYVKTADNEAQKLRQLFRQHYASKIIVVPVAVPYFYYDGMMIEVDVFGSRRGKTFHTFTDDSTSAELDVVDAGELMWASLLIPSGCGQSAEVVIPRLAKSAGISLDQVLSEQWFSANEAGGRQIQFMRGSGLPDPCHIVGVTPDGFDILGYFSVAGEVTSSTRFTSTDHKVDSTEIRLVMSKQYFEVTGFCREEIGLVGQTERIMRGIKWSLQHSGLTFDDVRKSTTYYIAGNSAEELHDNMKVRNRYYKKPGPASTGLPVCAFPLSSSSLISIRVFGKLPSARKS